MAKQMVFFQSFLLIFILLFANGCTYITKDEAEAKAAEFVGKNVKFFAREDNLTLKLPQYRIESMTSFRQNSDWFVVMHVSSKLGNQTKNNDLSIKLDGKGNVIEFNGKEVKRG